MYYSIDRFEETIAVMQDDDGNTIDVARTLLPANARQGDVLVLKDEHWIPAPDETARRRDHARRLQERLLNKKKS